MATVPSLMRELAFDQLQDLPMPEWCSKPWIPYPRKLTVVDGQKYLLKVDTEARPKARLQHDAEVLKPLFDLRPMGHELVYVTDKQAEGILLRWHEAMGPLHKVPTRDWVTPPNLAALWRILVFDGVIGNNDRMVSNLLLLKYGELPKRETDVTILAVDEGEADRSPDRWVKVSRRFKELLWEARDALESLLEGVEHRADRAAAIVERPAWIQRLRDLPVVVEATKAQVRS